MITKSELIESVSDSALNKALFEELVDGYLALHKSFYRKDYEKTLIKSGKFVETTFQILEFLLDGDYSADPSFNDIQDRLEQTKRDEYPESFRLIIPRRAKVMYGLRSKRGGAHKADIDPQYMDATCVASDSSWILSELIRLYSNEESTTVENLLNQVVTRSLPFVEEFEDGDIMVLIDSLSCKEEELLVLYHFYPARISNENMKQYLDHQTQENILMSLQRSESQKLIHRNEDGSKLTMKGRKYVEETHGTELNAS